MILCLLFNRQFSASLLLFLILSVFVLRKRFFFTFLYNVIQKAQTFIRRVRINKTGSGEKEMYILHEDQQYMYRPIEAD